MYSNINTRGNEGYSRYNALIVGLDGNNFRNTGMQFTAHYTFAKANDNLSSTFSEGAFNSNLRLWLSLVVDYDLGIGPFTADPTFGNADSFQTSFEAKQEP